MQDSIPLDPTCQLFPRRVARVLLRLIVCSSLLCAPTVWAVDARQCLKLKVERGNVCYEDRTSIQVKETNQCNQRIYVKTCLEKIEGGWSCASGYIMPGDTKHGSWTCRATGRYRTATCTGGYEECGRDVP